MAPELLNLSHTKLCGTKYTFYLFIIIMNWEKENFVARKNQISNLEMYSTKCTLD